MKVLTKYFLRGLLFVVPIALTVLILYKCFIFIDNIIKVRIPGLGFIITICGITLIGFLTSNFITKKIINLIEKLFEKLPVIKLIYNSIKDIIQAVIGEKKKFGKPVLVEIEKDIKVLGFMTKESLKNFDLENQAAVYIPQSYNFAGNLIIVDKSKIEILNNVDSSSILPFILSAGLIDEKN